MILQPSVSANRALSRQYIPPPAKKPCRLMAHTGGLPAPSGPTTFSLSDTAKRNWRLSTEMAPGTIRTLDFIDRRSALGKLVAGIRSGWRRAMVRSPVTVADREVELSLMVTWIIAVDHLFPGDQEAPGTPMIWPIRLSTLEASSTICATSVAAGISVRMAPTPCPVG
jgi:hypothetical protein